MKIILLSGGSGKRLWPLSNSVMSKQFLEILPTDDGKTESMVQRVYRQISKYTNGRIVVVAPEFQKELIEQQLGNSVEFVSEPCRKGTYNAIKLACSRIVNEQQVNLDQEQVCVIPIDLFAEDDFFSILSDIENSIKKSGKMITLVGIKPTYPSTKYGYIVPDEDK